MKQVMKRLTALLLAGIMIISMIPELTVKAAQVMRTFSVCSNAEQMLQEFWILRVL